MTKTRNDKERYGEGVRERFEDTNFKPESQQTIATAISIIADYEAQGYQLTLRQLYYQFVARDLIPNTERSYKNLGNLVSKARIAGLIAWTALEDRGRTLIEWPANDDPADVIRDSVWRLRFDIWERMNSYVEVWVEKEALRQVVESGCRKRYTPHMACKGYLSQSEAWRAGKRFEEAAERGQHCVLIHLGDHDPSGVDMTRDNAARVGLFSWLGPRVDVRRIALNMDQVEEYGPPPNPAKITDSRASEYIAQYGNTSWELDALEPAVIADLIESTVEEYVDADVWEAAEAEQERERAKLRWVARHWAEVMELRDQ